MSQGPQGTQGFQGVDSPSTGNARYVELAHTESQGVPGGQCAAGVWTILPITDKLVDANGICTLAGNYFTLPAGTYNILAHQSGQTPLWLRLFNTCGSSAIFYGPESIGYGTHLSGQFVLTGISTLAIQYFCTTTSGYFDLGNPLNVAGLRERYLTVDIWEAANLGPQGLQGTNPGVQGPQGRQGYQGFQGRQGLQGLQGIVGLQGNSGNIGFQGVQGRQGIQGVQGIVGWGIQGSQGPGLAGPQGLQGTNPGVQGPQGWQGVIGFQGSQGLQGFHGDEGFQGVQGANPGPPGIQGSQGVQGNQGTQGTQGFSGFQGFQGFQGLQGSGLQGFQGLQGVTFSRYNVYSTVGEEVEVLASGTGVTYGRTGNIGTFSIPTGTRIFSAMMRIPGGVPAGGQFIVDLGTSDMGNSGLDNRWQPIINCIREDTGAMVSVTVTFNVGLSRYNINNLNASTTNHLRLAF